MNPIKQFTIKNHEFKFDDDYDMYAILTDWIVNRDFYAYIMNLVTSWELYDAFVSEDESPQHKTIIDLVLNY